MWVAMKSKSIHLRFFILTVIFLLILAGLGYRVVWLHTEFTPPQKSHPLAKNIERGIIYDASGHTLAVSELAWSIGIKPRQVRHRPKKLAQLQNILDIAPEKMNTLLGKQGFQWLKREISHDKARAVERLDLPGITILREFRRHYPYDNLFAHTVGFVDIDNRGREGIERRFDSLLSGDHIPLTMDEALAQHFGSGLRGNAVHLTLHRMPQFILDQELQRAYKRHKAHAAYAILMESNTGKIIASSVYPTFDPNNIQSSRTEHRRNRIITDSFEPGSTFKIFLAAALFEEGLVSTKDTFYCPGYIRKEGHTIHCSRSHGKLSFANVLKKSCNVGIIKAGRRLSKEKLYRYLNGFGFGERTGLPLTGEQKGILRPPSEWSAMSQYSLSIGYEISVTALQLVRAAAAIANGGRLMKPRLVEYVKGSNGELLRRVRPQAIRRVISQKTAQKLMHILHEVTLPGGTGVLAAPSHLQVAGKTGTAVKSEPGEGYQKGKFVASFLGFFPYKNPRYTLLVVVDEPQGTYWGGKIASPVFRKITERLIHHFRLMDYIPAGTIAQWQPRLQPWSNRLDNKHFADFKGLSRRDALLLAQVYHRVYGWRISFHGYGHVTRQKPAAGTLLRRLPQDTRIQLWFQG
jgi:cell division protein FtsI (penicillin-binding protein 3)